MSKWILLGFSFLLVNVVNAQEIKADSATVLPDTSSLQAVAKDLLSKQLTFTHSGGKLESVLDKLASEQQIKISYSSDRIDHVTVPKQDFSSVSLTFLLSSLLKNTGFTYIVVGTVVVIVPGNVGEVQENTLKADTGSLADSLAEYVYVPEEDSANLSKKLKKHIQKIYTEEQEWSAYRRSGNNPEFLPQSLPRFELHDYRYFVSPRLAIVPYMARIRNNTGLPWRDDLGFDRNIPLALRAEITAGMTFGNVFAEVGLAYQNLSAKVYYLENETPGNSPPKKDKTVTRVESARYSVVSIPVEVKIVRQKKNIFFGIGPELELAFINTERETIDAFRVYYEDASEGQRYQDRDLNFSLAAGLHTEAGVLIHKRMAASAGLEYNHFFMPFSKNSLYSFYPNFLELQLSYTFFF